MNKLPLSPRSIIIGMASAFAATVVIGALLADRADYDVSERQAEDRSRQVAVLLEEHVHSAFAASNVLAQRVVDMVDLIGMDVLRSEARWKRLRSAADSLDQVRSIWVADAKGDLILSTMAWPAPTLNIADREYFRALAEGESLHVGALVHSKLLDALVSVYARRVNKPDGSFGGAVVIGLEGEYFTDVMTDAEFGPSSSLGIFRNDGALVAYAPFSEGMLDRDHRDSLQPFRAVADKSPHAVVQTNQFNDGRPSFTSFRAVPGLPLVVSASLSHQDAFAGYEERRNRRILLGLIALSAVASLAWLGLRAVGRSERSAAALARGEQRLRQALRTSTTALIELDRDLRYVDIVNPQMPGADKVIGLTPHALFEPISARVVEDFYRQVLETGVPMGVTMRLMTQAGNSDILVETHAEPDFDRQGHIVGVRASSQDVTFRVRVTQALRTALSEKDLLFREIHHRVKNNLQIVASLLTIQSLQAEDPKMRDGIEDILDRISSMALVHTILYQHDDVSKVHMPRMLSTLCETLAVSHGARERGITVEVDCEDYRLDLEKAVPLALIANEAVSNAFKHAFPDGRQGAIKIGFATDAGRCLLRVHDDGVGLGERAMRAGSIGMMLISGLADQVGGRSRFDHSSGTRFELAFAG